MEFSYDFGGKLLTAILLVLVVSDQLTAPAADPRDAAATPATAEVSCERAVSSTTAADAAAER